MRQARDGGKDVYDSTSSATSCRVLGSSLGCTCTPTITGVADAAAAAASTAARRGDRSRSRSRSLAAGLHQSSFDACRKQKPCTSEPAQPYTATIAEASQATRRPDMQLHCPQRKLVKYDVRCRCGRRLEFTWATSSGAELASTESLHRPGWLRRHVYQMLRCTFQSTSTRTRRRTSRICWSPMEACSELVRKCLSTVSWTSSCGQGRCDMTTSTRWRCKRLLAENTERRLK